MPYACIACLHQALTGQPLVVRDDAGEEAPAAKQAKQEASPEPQAGAGSALLGLAAYGDDSDSD